jgi:hypothetical protein
MKQRLQLLLIFYKSFWIYTVAISVGAWYALEAPLYADFLRILPAFILIKLVTHVLVLYLNHTLYAEQLFFYTNLGISAMRLYVAALGLDLLLFLLFMGLVHLILHSINWLL